jgi:hypothetical protein
VEPAEDVKLPIGRIKKNKGRRGKKDAKKR